jgi:hypothetical protein
MTKFLISFPASAMNVPTEELAAVGEDARAVIREAKRAGIYVFGGGIDSSIAPVMVRADGVTLDQTYPQTKHFDGGFCVLELPSRDEAIRWAAKIAGAARIRIRRRELNSTRTCCAKPGARPEFGVTPAAPAAIERLAVTDCAYYGAPRTPEDRT